MATQPLTSTIRPSVSRQRTVDTADETLTATQWWLPQWDRTAVADSARDLFAVLREEAQAARSKWAGEVESLQAALRDLRRQNVRRLDVLNTIGSLQEISDFHDETMEAAFGASPFIWESDALLGALRRAQANALARQTRLEKRISLTSFWKRRDLKRNLAALQDARVQILDLDLGTVQRERLLLVEEIEQLHAQARAFRVELRERSCGSALKWERQRQEWMKIGMENWERAKNGLRLRPQPDLAKAPVSVRVEGVVKYYDVLQGRGVLQSEGGGPSIYVTRSSLQNASILYPGQRVGYLVRQTSSGPWAQDVIVIRQRL
jgi:cold shock CspA family protein